MKKPNKYRARRTMVDGFWFHSQAEANRWSELQLLVRAGQISKLQRQVPFLLSAYCYETGDPVDLSSYVADFVYIDTNTGNEVVEDVKGFKTTEYKLKRSFMKACHGIVIFETGSKAILSKAKVCASGS